MSWICVHLTALKKAMMYNVYLMEYQSLVHSSVRQISLKYLLCSSYSVSSCNFNMFKISSCSFTWVSNSTLLFFVEYHMHVECENFKSWFLCICISTCLGQYVAVKFQCNICINTFCIHVWLYQFENILIILTKWVINWVKSKNQHEIIKFCTNNNTHACTWRK